LGGTSACSFSVILHENSLLGDSPAASFSYNLTKDLTAHLHHQLCAVLPSCKLSREIEIFTASPIAFFYEL
ncbi:MAG: hypothetical protein IJ060_12925, partial [Oscillospiraceae bacterium]|nr:hypothetical protein [Oscillospiraceae bacterium]